MKLPCPCKVGRGGDPEGEWAKILEVVNSALRAPFPEFRCVDLTGVDCFGRAGDGYWQLHLGHSTRTEIGWFEDFQDRLEEVAHFVQGAMINITPTEVVIEVKTHCSPASHVEESPHHADQSITAL